MTNPIHAINGLQSDLLKRLNALHHHIACEADYITEEWSALGNAGGQRADHAAQFLARLRAPLADLEQFAAACPTPRGNAGPWDCPAPVDAGARAFTGNTAGQP